MEAYTGFAEVYDQFMNNVPYERWAEYLRGLFLEYGVRNGLMLELGCGTGTMTEQMAGIRIRYDRRGFLGGHAGGGAGEADGIRA